MTPTTAPHPRTPTIAIVGRPNVGKSSLLNALVGKLISIVQDMPGVTRDRVSMPWRIDDRWVELVDTGGYGIVDADKLTDHIHEQIELAITRADLVLFVVDCHDGLTPADQVIATLLRRGGVPTLLVANKCDGTRLDSVLADFARLGFGTPLGVAAANGRNLNDLIAAIRERIDLSSAPTELPEPEMHIAIVGKRNAGKSTLVNAIASLYEGDPQSVIVSEVPGTTRDSIDVRIEKDGQPLVVIDTAGVRKKRQIVSSDIEFYSFHRAERSIRRADVVILLIDSTDTVSEPDKKLAQYIAEQQKPVVIVINKWDLALQVERERLAADQAVDDNKLMDEFRKYLRHELRWIDYAPIAFATAKDVRNVQAVVDHAQRLVNQSRLRITTAKLNQTLRAVLQERTPSTPNGRRAKIFYATQIETAPPTIALIVNRVQYIDETYKRFLVNRLRELLPYPEVPIQILIRPRGQRDDSAPLEEMDDKQVAKAGQSSEPTTPARKPGLPRKPSRPKPQRHQKRPAARRR